MLRAVLNPRAPMHFLRVLLLLSLAIFAIDCKPSVGSSCDKREARCIDRQSQLICQNGKFIQSPCKGPKGCSLTPDGVACDISGNKMDEPCSTDDEGAASCSDKRAKVVCMGGKYVSMPCRGPHGCEMVDNKAICDMSVAEPGELCKDADKVKACSVDGKEYLACEGSKMTLQFYCLGPNGCKADKSTLNCDMSFARDKDPCTKEMEGKNACNLDKSSIVVCKDGKFRVDEECKKGTRCIVEGTIKCEKPDAG